MEKDTRSKVVGQLDELRDQVAEKLGEKSGEVTAHVDELRSLVNEGGKEARSSASSLEKRLLAWEAEHPQLVALANRVARALEDSGL